VLLAPPDEVLEEEAPEPELAGADGVDVEPVAEAFEEASTLDGLLSLEAALWLGVLEVFASVLEVLLEPDSAALEEDLSLKSVTYQPEPLS
jgi:hypothetical protein